MIVIFNPNDDAYSKFSLEKFGVLNDLAVTGFG